MTETSESPKQNSAARKIAWGTLSVLAGAVLLCACSVLNKLMVGAPMTAKAFTVPLLFGGGAGLVAGLLVLALKQRVRALETEASLLRRAEDALNDFGRIAASIADHVSWVDSDYIYRAVNKAYLEAHSRTREEIVGHTVAEVLGDDVFERLVKAHLDRCLNGETVAYGDWFEFRGLGRRYMDVACHPYRNDDGSVSGVVVTSRDSTQLRQTQETLAESEERFRSLFEGMRDGVAVYEAVDDGADFLFLDWNPAGQEMDGGSREDAIGRRVTDVFPGVEKFGLLDVMRRVWRTGVPEDQPVSIYEDERVTFWRQNTVYRLPSGNVVAVYSDITERKQAEEALREAELRYRTIADFTYDWEYWANPDGTMRYVSLSCERITGYAREQFIADAHFIDELVLPEDQQIWTAHRHAVSGDSKPQGVQFRIRRRDGETVWIDHVCRPVVDEQGRFLGHRASNRDITERLRTQKRLQEAQRLESLSILAGGIAHDFNNLLQGMLGYAELVRSALPENSPERGMIQEIEDAGRRAAHLSRQMLAYSGKGAFLASRLDPAGLVAAQADTLASIASPHARLKRTLPNDLPPVMADAGQLTQVLQNLVTNAAESFEEDDSPSGAGDTDALITIQLSVVDAGCEDLVGSYMDDDLPAGRYVRFEVIDNGCGMDAETVSRVFDPFFTTKFQGRGLGMAATLGIVRGHRGVIHVVSEAGRGTTVTVLLPAAGPVQESL
ncbi:MAG: PAS domain S-box protein, partial [Spirochaetales bacterium]|nr:PAS domain S-box protein [Spirochaetales bacterium]